MEKIKDYFYEKSDIFFASVVVLLVVAVILYNLNGWLIIDSEASKYNDIPIRTQEQGQNGQGDITNTAEENNPLFEQPVQNQEESAHAAKPQEEAGSQEKDAPTTTENKPADAKEEAASKPSEQKPATTKPEQKPSAIKPPAAFRKITIASGSSAKSIADALKNQGLISDSKDFLNKLVASGKETKLQSGTFQIKEGSTVNQIIDVLTK